MRVSKGTWRRAFMNLRCTICCLNMESPRECPGQHALYGGTSTPAIYLSRPRALSAFPFVAFLFSPTPSPALLPRLVNLDPGNGCEEERAEGWRKGMQRGGRKEGKREKTVEISRRHHSLPPRRLSVSPPSLWPYKTAFHPHSQWRTRDAAESRAELSWAESSRFARSHFNRIARARRKRRRRKAREKTGRFFRSRPSPPALLSRQDRKHRGARREGWDPWIIARSYFFFLYIVLYLGGVHTHEAQGWLPRADTALTRARKTRGS